MSSTKLKIGIVGLPNVGKSTLFNALTKKKVDISNYPFTTIEPNVGIVRVPDERLEKLARLCHSKNIIPAIVEFVDIAGLVKGAAEGEGLGNKFLSHIKEADVIAEVVRVFEDQGIIRVTEKSSPAADIEVIEYELILKDLEIVSKRLDAVRSEARGKKKEAEKEVEILEKIKKELAAGQPVEKNLLSKVAAIPELLTAKPIICVFNVSEKQIKDKWQPDENVKKKIRQSPFVTISAKTESELAELSDEEKREYLKTLDLAESGLDQLIKIGYETLGLITFFTAGEDETRAWTIPENSKAPRAGRAIHSDFEEKFIRAEVIIWQKLVEAGSWSRARELGWLRIEGKNYIVQDGDVIEFKI